MKRKIDWKKTNAFGGVVLELSEKERMTLNNHVASMNQGDDPVFGVFE